MRFILELAIDTTNGEPVGFQVRDALNHATTTINGMLGGTGEPDYCIFARDSKNNIVGSWSLVDEQAAPAVGCCCGATDTPAPTMPAVLAMPTAAELAQQQALGAMAAPGADDRHRGAVASMASVAGMAGLPTAGELSGSGVAAESPRENIADRITSTGSVAAAAGPTGSPRRRNLASRPTKSQLVDTIVADYLANGKDAAVATFDAAQDLHNLTNEESKSIALMVRNRVGDLTETKR